MGPHRRLIIPASLSSRLHFYILVMLLLYKV